VQSSQWLPMSVVPGTKGRAVAAMVYVPHWPSAAPVGANPPTARPARAPHRRPVGTGPFSSAPRRTTLEDPGSQASKSSCENDPAPKRHRAESGHPSPPCRGRREGRAGNDSAPSARHPRSLGPSRIELFQSAALGTDRSATGSRRPRRKISPGEAGPSGWGSRVRGPAGTRRCVCALRARTISQSRSFPSYLIFKGLQAEVCLFRRAANIEM
jgi:hypothetical protein